MKIHSTRRKRLLTALAITVNLVLSQKTSRATEDLIINAFNAAAEAANWARWWGAAPQEYEFDPGVDAGGNPSSGSLKISVTFNKTAYTNDNQFAALRAFSALDASKYESLAMDILWDPSSPMRPFNDFGYLEPGFRNSDFSQNWLAGQTITTNAGWKHLLLPINPNAAKITNVTGIVLKMWSGDSSWGQSGIARLWVDNVRLIGRPDAPPPPPTMRTEPAVPGLKLFAIAPGNQYQRQSIRTATPTYSWVGAADPVTYSVTINDYPSRAYSGFQTHVFIVPGSTIPASETTPDWIEPHCVFLNIANNADGTAYAAFRYKINQPQGNSMMYGSGTIAVVGSPQVKGTWNLTFNPGGDISLSAPNGSYTNFSMPPEAVALFNAPAYAYFGVQPNQQISIGQAATLGQIQISGVTSPIDEPFQSATLDTTIWQLAAEDPSGVAPVASDALLWVNWTLPDTGYRLRVTDDLGFTAWSDFSVSKAQIGDFRRVVIRQSELPLSSTGNYFFELLRNP
jgi:hypothetical protein